MSRRTKRPAPLGEILEFFFNRAGYGSRLSEQRIMDSWQKVVGEGIGEQTQPVRIQNRSLHVRVSNSVWMQQLQFMKGMILKKIKKETDVQELEDIRFFIGEVEGKDQNSQNGGKAEERPREEWKNLSENEMSQIRREVASLPDPEMRNIFERVFARSLSASKSLGRRGEKG